MVRSLASINIRGPDEDKDGDQVRVRVRVRAVHDCLDQEDPPTFHRRIWSIVCITFHYSQRDFAAILPPWHVLYQD